jgi:peptide/nickel transport system ATP-binding protein
MPSTRRRESMKNVTINAQGLVKHFPIKLGLLKSLLAKENPFVHAVDGVSFHIASGEVFGLVGESGCGKTTTGRLLVRLLDLTEGQVVFKGTDLVTLSKQEMQSLRRYMQIIFQDPYESLDPRMSIYDIIAEPLRIQKIVESEEEISQIVAKSLEEFGLVPAEEYMYRFAHELSGGQRQRVAIARAFVLRPEFIVADEPVSMLDASIRSEVLKLLLASQKKYETSFLYITHDIALARHVCDRLAVMYLGKIVEKGDTEEVIHKPLHPYTEALIAAVPVPDPTARRIRVTLKGEVPSAINPPTGCRFNTRCPHAMEICRKKEPPLIEADKGHFVACHLHAKK